MVKLSYDKNLVLFVKLNLLYYVNHFLFFLWQTRRGLVLVNGRYKDFKHTPSGFFIHQKNAYA